MSTAETVLPDLSPLDQLSKDVYDDGICRIEHKNYYLCLRGPYGLFAAHRVPAHLALARSVERAVSAEDLWHYAEVTRSRSTQRVCMFLCTGCAENSCLTSCASTRW